MHEEKRGAGAPHFSPSDTVVLTITYGVALLGVLCVLAGGGIAFYTAWILFSLFDDPNSVPWLARLIGQGGEYLQATRGTLDGRAFDIELGREIHLMGLLFIGVLLLWAVAGLAKALISAGITLLGPALKAERK